jgi:hypothetical protein
MKKSFLIAAFFILTGFSSLFANDAGKAVKEAFNKTFTKAKDVKWSTENGLNLATFQLNGETLEAYYKDDATLVIAIHHLLSDRLPIFLQTSLKENYPGYWITDLIESANQDSSHYHISIENADQRITLESIEATEWSIEKLEAKN